MRSGNRILVVGGGPGGLYFATLMKRADPASQVTVLERNPPQEAYGFGVVFSEQTMLGLRAADEETYRALTSHAPKWDAIELRHRGETINAGGHRFWAITRTRLLEVLQERARHQGVELSFREEVRELADVEDCDLLVGADGVNSLVRRSHAEHFGTSESYNRSNYIWLGCTKRFEGFAFIFEEDDHGAFGAHIYPIGDELSTFVVDASDETLRNAGLAGAQSVPPGESDERSLAYLEEVFAKHLDGHRLVANNSRWLKFREVRNERWSRGNVVLLGDAAHTAHPNVGSGTKMAVDDALALCDALRADDDVASALRAYERERIPAVERIQRAAHAAGAWWDWFQVHMRREPDQFAYHYLTRTPRIGYEEMQRRDRRLAKHVEASWERTVSKTAGRPLALSSPLAAPLRLRDVELPNRLAAEVEIDARNVADRELAYLGGYAVCGAGLVVATLRSSGGATSLERIVDLVHGETDGKLGVGLPVVDDAGPGVPDLLIDSVQLADAARFDLLLLEVDRDLTDAPARPDDVLLSIEAARAAWPAAKPLAVNLLIADPLQTDVLAWLSLVARVRDAGADLVGVAIGGSASSPSEAEERTWRHLLLSDLARNQAGALTMLMHGVADHHEVDDAVLSGRADICCAQPRLGSQPWSTSHGSLPRMAAA